MQLHSPIDISQSRMKSKLKICLFLCCGLVAAVMGACTHGLQTGGNSGHSAEQDSIQRLDFLRSCIDSLERELAKDSLAIHHNTTLLDSLGTLCVELANGCRETAFAPVALWKAARAFRAAGSYPQAIECGRALTDAYPQHDLAASALFHNALIFNDDLNNIASAEFYLDRLLREYPSDSLAVQAAPMKSLLGISDQELLGRIRK
jgi:tetratricopeptide (TPR) repeat protein